MITINSNYSNYMVLFIEESGYTIRQHDNIWVSSDDVAVQAIIDSFDSLPPAQAEAIAEIAQYASDLIDKDISPIKQKRINADALNATIKKGKGAILPEDQAKLDRYEASIIYPDAIFAQYDIEEAAMLAITDWTLINIEAAKTNLDNIV